MARDDADAARARLGGAVHQRRCEREIAARRAGEHRQRLGAAGQREPRDGMRVGPRPRLRGRVALRRAIPRAIQQVLRELGFRRQPEAHREQRQRRARSACRPQAPQAPLPRARAAAFQAERQRHGHRHGTASKACS